MEAKRLDLKVDEEFRRLCPAMGKETRQELERLLSQGGSTPPIRTWKQFAKKTTRIEAHLPGGRCGGAGALALVQLPEAHGQGEPPEGQPPTCSPTPRGSRFTWTHLPSTCGRSSKNWGSLLLFICIPCGTTSSPLCSTREWTSRPLRSWLATRTPLSWRGHTAIPR